MPQQSSDDQDDNDNTDELPVLLETVVLEDELTPSVVHEDTGQHTALYQAKAEEHSQAAALRTDLAVRSAKIDALETEVARLSDRCRELADRDAELVGNERRLRKELEARAAEIDQLRAAAATAEHSAAYLQSELATRGPARGDPPVQELLEDNAALATYIAGRRRWWDDLEAERTSLAARVAALEHELVANVAQRKRAEVLAAQETSRAVSLRAKLVDHAHRLEAAERALGGARRGEREVRPEPPVTPPPAMEPAVRIAAATTPTAAVADVHAPGAGTVGPTEPLAEPAFEMIGELEGQVEFKRQQVAAQLVELRDREQQLRAATTDLERLRAELVTLRTDLDRSKADAARLERTVLDKDRALEARDARIATLQDELNQRLGALQKLNAMALSPQVLDKPPERSRSVEPNVESVPAPALICLTGEAPKLFPLRKKHVTVGRAAHCDLQVLTHFVSREHARFSVAGDKILIEDLGSRNGLFVNSVRVERQELQHGDLITIGETQFRFVESMAH
jgi:ABC-type transporter Mla subunit MlaD